MNWSGALFASCSSDKKNWSITQFIKYLKYKLQNLGQFFCTECLCNLFFISYSCSKYLGFNGIQSSVYFYTYPACRFYHCLNSKPLMLGGNVRLLFSFLDSTSHETAGLERQRRPPPPPTAFAATLRGSQEGFCASIEGHGFGKKLWLTDNEGSSSRLIVRYGVGVQMIIAVKKAEFNSCCCHRHRQQGGLEGLLPSWGNDSNLW